MEWGSLLYFFVVCLGLGSSSELFRHPFKGLERLYLWAGVGLSLWVVLGVLLNAAYIPLDWRIFTLAALLMLISLVTKKGLPKITFSITPTQIFALLTLAIVGASFALYHRGAFSYPWIEDDDAWEHSKSVALIRSEKTAYHDRALVNVYGNDFIRYTDPYPPGYAIVLGTVAQTNGSVLWTMKYFNALLVSLGILFFYMFARVLFSKARTAFFATLLLAMIPSYLSHFIWAHSLALPLFFPALTGVLFIKEHKEWTVPAGILSAAIVLAQPTKGIKFFGVLGIIFIVQLYIKGYWKRVIAVGCIALALSMVWWIPMLVKHEGPSALLLAMGMKGNVLEQRGTATRAYSLADFLLYKDGHLREGNQINNPVGLGIMPFLLLLGGSAVLLLGRKQWKEKEWQLMLLLLLLYALSGVFQFPLAFFSFRFWSILAVAAALIGGYFIDVIWNSIPIKLVSLILIALIFGLSWVSAGALKAEVNTSQWNPGVLWNADFYGGLQQKELGFYMGLKGNIPAHAKIFPFCYYGARKLISLDYDFCAWCNDDVDMFNRALNTTPEDLHTYLRQTRYGFAIIDSQCAEFASVEEADRKIAPFLNATGFSILYRDDPVVLFRIV